MNLEKKNKGTEFCNKIGRDFNCFGSYSKIAAKMWDEASKENRKELLLYTCMMAFELSHSYRMAGERFWDERKRAACEFADENKQWFRDIFTDLTGISYYDLVKDEDGHFVSLLNIRIITDAGLENLAGFAEKWTNEHSTIKQSVFGGIVNGVLIPENPEHNFVGAEGDRAVFPFI